MKSFKQFTEKKLTSAEKKKREEIAKAIEKDNPNMPMDKKMAIATATAKRVAEEPTMTTGPNVAGTSPNDPADWMKPRKKRPLTRAYIEVNGKRKRQVK